ncbi:ABC transporter permease, partial [Acidovorax cavernicola]
MLYVLARRLLSTLGVLLLLTALVFVATEVLPGDAVLNSLSADDLSLMSEQEVQALRAQHGLDRPAILRYGQWLWAVLHGDLGRTIIGQAPVTELIAYPIRNSLLLGLLAAAVAIPTALLLGMAAAYWQNRWPDRWVSGAAILGYSVPECAS